jgi:hypothetical protein
MVRVVGKEEKVASGVERDFREELHGGTRVEKEERGTRRAKGARRVMQGRVDLRERGRAQLSSKDTVHIARYGDTPNDIVLRGNKNGMVVVVERVEPTRWREWRRLRWIRDWGSTMTMKRFSPWVVWDTHVL